MKKFKFMMVLCILFTSVLSIGMHSVVADEERAPKIYVSTWDQQLRDQLGPPIIKEDSKLIPFISLPRAMLYNVGQVFDVDWNQSTNEITLTSEDKEIKLTVGDKTAYVNNKKIPLQSAPQIALFENHQYVYLPVTFINHQFDIYVKDSLFYNDVTVYPYDTLLCLAVWDKDKETITRLVENGINIDEYNSTCSPLHAAIDYNDAEMVDFLLQLGANVNVVYEDKTALKRAMFDNDEKMIKTILQYEPEIKTNDKAFYDGIHILLNEDTNAMQQWLKDGFDPYLENVTGDTLLSIAVDWDKENMISTILENKPIDRYQRGQGERALLHAIDGEKTNIINLLLDAGATLSLENNELVKALENDNVEKVKLLLAAKANVLANKSSFSMTALDHAIKKNNKDVIKLLFATEPDFEEDTIFYKVIEALIFEDEEALQKLLESGLDINEVNKNGDMLLHFAVNVLDAKAFERLLNIENINVDVPNEEMETPLMLASKQGYADKVETLIRFGADVNYRNNDTSVLEHAIKDSHPNVVTVLIEGNVDVNVQDNDGETALMIAANRNEEIVKILLEANADVNVQNNKGKTAIMFAAEEKEEQIVQSLIEANADVNVQDNDGETALIYALKNSYALNEMNKGLIAHLLQAGADSTITTVDGYSAVDLAIRHMNKYRDKEILLWMYDENFQFSSEEQAYYDAVYALVQADSGAVQEIIDTGFDPNISHRNGDTLLNIAVHLGKEAVELLLNVDEIDVNVQDSKGITALMYAVYLQDEQITNMLLDAGANPNLKADERLSYYELNISYGIEESFDSETALMLAVARENTSLVKVLLDAGADPNIATTYRGETALMYAVELHNVEITKLLLDAKADVNQQMENGVTPLIITAKVAGDPTIAEMLIEAGAMIDHRDEKEKTALMWNLDSLIIGSNIAYTLIEAGADVNTTYKDNFLEGFTPLTVAVVINNMHSVTGTQLIEAMLNNGADVNAPDGSISSALLYASYDFGYGIDFEVIQMLLDHGADPQLKDENGDTILDYIKELKEDAIAWERDYNPLYDEVISLLEKAMQ
ncbi:ankyrin repeat domain-containing protein [Longirhabdus pacifica]|uniref:ankyrin repeat domain-containing protein n=1 Tax=Longirhabdus pacifica TaxID=2305227 RepID=UPI00100933A6|nr:ankyrin repeat domain-containing protein [Longirhabdus pacifica]